MKLHKNKIKMGKRKKGVALVIAILISSIVLSVGLGIFSRTYKELILAFFWKQAQTSFAAADSGLECALYWDKKAPAATSATCFGTVISGWNPSLQGTFTFSNVSVSGGCVSVIITKDTSVVPTQTTIVSRGRSSCASGGLRAVESLLGVIY